MAEEQKSLFIQDIADVLTSYIETERKIHEEAQDLIANRNVDFSSLGRFKRELAKKCNFGLGDDFLLAHDHFATDIQSAVDSLEKMMEP